MDVMLSVLQDDDIYGHDVNTVIKAVCLGLTIAASDTTAATLTWALTLLLNHPDILKKAQEELLAVVGLERQVNESDIKNLVYLQAILKETMRHYPAAPLLIPHESIQDCTVSGYHIPAQTQLYVNVWKIHHDPGVWCDPDMFKPERFLTTHKEFDVRGKNYELMPFSSGRRMCPGVTFSLQVMHLMLASFLHGFEIGTLSNEGVDTSEGTGLSYVKASTVDVLVSPRLSSRLYV